LLPNNFQEAGVLLFQTTKPFGFVGRRIAVFLLPGVKGRRTAAEVTAQVLDWILALFGVLEQLPGSDLR